MTTPLYVLPLFQCFLTILGIMFEAGGHQPLSVYPFYATLYHYDCIYVAPLTLCVAYLSVFLDHPGYHDGSGGR